MPLAGPASRALAWMLDSVLLVGGLALASSLISLAGMAWGGELAGNVFSALLMLVVFLVVNLYFVYFEILDNGRTPGKRALGLRALRLDGRSLSLRDSLLRNFFRPLDWLPFGYGLGALAMLAGGQRQRVGDLLAGTVVVHENSAPVARGLEPVYQIDQARLLSQRDLQWIRLFQQWSPLLLPPARRRLAARLALALADRMGVEAPTQRSSEGFLADLADSRDSGSSSRF